MSLFDRIFGLREEQVPTPPAVPAPSPVPSVRRSARRNSVAYRSFQAGQSDRLTSGWSGFPTNIDEIIRRHWRSLVARSREQYMNNDYLRAYVGMCVTNIVGHQGIVMQAQSTDPDGTLDSRANDAIEKSFADWGKRQNCDITGRKSWRSIQRAWVVSLARDGEAMARKITGDDAGPFGFALQMIDPVRCPVDMDRTKMPGGNFIRHGIEFNGLGRPIAYYFYSLDAERADYHWGGRAFTRVPADEIIHGFVEDFEGQKRGLPWAATALWRLKQLKGFEDASLINARATASKMGFLKWDKDAEGPDAEYDPDEEIYMEFDPGTIQELPPGVEFQEWNPQYPNGEFVAFHKAMLRGVSAGWRVAYNNLASDLEGVNFSSIRQGTLSERDMWMELQAHVIETLVEPVQQEWLKRALLRGKITVFGAPLKPSRLSKYSNIANQGRRWSWVDPRADVLAAKESKNNFLASPGQLIRETGRDPQTVWREVGRDIQEMKKAGIPEELILAALSPKLNVPDSVFGGDDGDGAKVPEE